MGSLTVAELQKLRDIANQQSHLRLYGFGFETIWTGKVNVASPARGLQKITYDTGVFASGWAAADLYAGLVVYFSNDTTRRRRLLSISGGPTYANGELIVDWHDDLQLVDDEVITIAHAVLPEPKFSYFEANPTVFTKDGPPAPTGAGISYTDQNEKPVPHVVLGRHAVMTNSTSDFWYKTESIQDAEIVAAYQFIGNFSDAEARINLVNPGTYDLTTAIGSPTWSAIDGFMFSGSDALSTGIVFKNKYSALVLLEFPGSFPVAEQRFFGQRPMSGSDLWVLAVAPDTSSNFTFYFGTAGGALSFAANTGQNYVLGGTTDGGPVGLSKNYNTWDTTKNLNSFLTGRLDEVTTVDAWIGAVNNNNSGSAWGTPWTGNIKAVAIYNRELTASEVSQLATNMLALSSSTPPPGYLYVDATDSQAIGTGATISSYSWTFSPSSVSGAKFVDATAGQTYFKPGTSFYQRFILSCTVTDSNNKSATGRRAFIFDPDGAQGITDFSLGSITEARNSISVPATVTITAPDTSKTEANAPTITWSNFPERGLVLITKDTLYQDTATEISFRKETRYIDRHNIYYAGYIVSEQQGYSVDDVGQISLNLETVPQMSLYNLSLTGVGNSPTAWWEMLADYMYVAALLNHLIYWHSTLAEIMDWILPWSDTTKRSAVEYWTEGSLLERILETAGPYGRLMSVTGTAGGEVIVEKPINLLTTESARNAVSTILTLSDEDLTEDAIIRVMSRPEIVQITAEGGSSAGVMGSWTPYRSRAQNVKKASGSSETPYRQLMVTSQTELNNLVGRLNSMLNPVTSGLPKEIELNFAGEYSNVFSPAGQEWVNTGTEVFSTSRGANLRNTTKYNNLRLAVLQSTKTWDNVLLTERVNVIFEVESPQGLTGRTVTIPELGTLPDPATTPTITQQPAMLLGFYITGDDTNGVEVYIKDEATWKTRNTGLSTNQKKVNRLAVAPYWWRLQGSSDPEDSILWIATEGGILTSTDAGKSWTDRTPAVNEFNNTLPAGIGPTGLSYTWIDVFGSATDVNRIIVAQATYDTGSAAYVRWDMISTDGGYTWTIVYNNNSRGFGIAIDQDTGTQVYVVYWQVSTQQFLAGVRNLSLSIIGVDEDFGSATDAEITGETKKIELQRAYDLSVTDNKEYIFVNGLFAK